MTWQQLQHEIEHVRELLAERDKALELATAELHRRLDILNHAHESERENWERSLPREIFASFEREVYKWREEEVKWRETVTGELSTIQKLADAKAASNTKLITIIGFVLSALVIISRFYGH